MLDERHAVVELGWLSPPGHGLRSGPYLGAVLDDLALDGLDLGIGLRLRGRDLELRLLLVVIIVVLVAGQRVLELAHPRAERLAEIRQALGAEDHERDHEHDCELEWSDVWHRSECYS